jgi:hypothetical protein
VQRAALIREANSAESGLRALWAPSKDLRAHEEGLQALRSQPIPGLRFLISSSTMWWSFVAAVPRPGTARTIARVARQTMEMTTLPKNLDELPRLPRGPTLG